MRHWGGSGDYVEGKRVFAPPHGSFDPDWVAAVVLDREDPSLGERAALTRWAQRAWELRTTTGPRGVQPLDVDALAQHLGEDGAPAPLARAVATAVTDVAAAYHLDG